MSPSKVKNYLKIILCKCYPLFAIIFVMILILSCFHLKSQHLEKFCETCTEAPLENEAENSFDVSQIQKRLLDNQTLIITKEIESQNLVELRNLDELVMEKGGQPIRNIIFTTWRSGSTFLGQLVNSHPGSICYYEPFRQHEEYRINDSFSTEAVQQIQKMLNCHIDNSGEFMKFLRVNKAYLGRHPRIWNICSEDPKFCLDSNFLGKLCQKFPFLLVKTVRMKLALARPLLEDRTLNLRVLYLVRDPRAVMWSRFELYWWDYGDYGDPQLLCSDHVDDFFEAEKLSKDYPDRVMIVRYEDLCANPHLVATKIFKFFRLSLKPLEDPQGSVRHFIKNHTESIRQKNFFSTFRDTKKTPFLWIQKAKANFSLLVQIERVCKKALGVWGYNSVRSLKQISDPSFSPVKDLSLV